MKKTYALFILIFAMQICNAQFTNLNWKTGRHTSIDFKSGAMNVNLSDSNKSLVTLSSTSICDWKGDIIFYSNACRVYDKNGNVMPNGSGFNQGVFSNTYVNTDYYPATKATTIIPFPNDSNKFYLFYLNLEYSLDGTYIPNKLYYLVVDRTLNGGLGDVTIKDQVAISGDTLNKNMVFASKHGNGKDWWIVVRKHKSNKYYKILIDSSGVQAATSQVIGNNFNYPNAAEEIGNIALQGNKIVYLYISLSYQPFQMDLFDFDRCAGLLNNYQTILHPNTTDTISWWSSCFSPNGRFLYLNDKYKVYQIDLQATNLLNSVIVVGNNTALYRAFCKMEIAPDNKIYVAPYGSYEYMSVINKPDSFGIACNFVENAIQFGNHTTGPWADGGLPNTPNFALGKIDCGVGVQEVANTKEGLVIYPNPASQSIVISHQLLVNTIEVTDVLGRTKMVRQAHHNGDVLAVSPSPLERAGVRSLVGFEIDVSTLSNGIYFIKATDEKGNIMNAKFVKE
jgi:hypothetical protein